MAGIGFQLERMARQGGIGGFACAALHGAAIACGPWILTIVAVMLLHMWTMQHSQSGTVSIIQAIMVYSFSASVVVAAPFALVGVRLASDLIYSTERNSVPRVLLAALNWATAAALLIGYVIFALMARLPFAITWLAVAIVTMLTQIAVIGPFLTATRRHGPILLAYLGGISTGAAGVVLLDLAGLTSILLVLVATLAITNLFMLEALRSEFPTPDRAGEVRALDLKPVLHVGVAGLANALALWIDKWMLWSAPGSTAIVGSLRVNPVYDPASFLGLLTLIPGLTLMLVMSETRLERAFSHFARGCTGTAKLTRIEEAREDLVVTIVSQLRLLLAMQVVIATACWVLAPEIFRVLGYDPRGIFSFRFTVLGAVFHLVAIYCAVILSYYDLFGRILLVWLVFTAGSAVGTAVMWDLGVAGLGWGYLAGALCAATVGLAMLGNATIRLIYLMFAGNNPSVVGKVRYWT
ncbi:MAG: exopolysaccharide Pel transporter PelG [Novosphingobium sp.]